LIGVNNRNLHTFEIDLATTGRLACMMPTDRLLVAESGIHSKADIDRLKLNGAGAFLVGEVLMRGDNIDTTLKNLLI